MFIQKDNRKLIEIVCAPKDPKSILLARKGPEFNGSTHEVLCDATAQYFAQAKYLNLYDNKLTSLKGMNIIAPFNALEELNIGYNKLTILPKNLGDVHSLKKLWADDNLLTGFPAPVLRLTNLTHLRLSGNTIDIIPEGISALSALEELAVDSNAVTALPQSLGDLTNLKILQLRGNKLTALPESIGGLKKLNSLSLTTNALQRLPRGLGDCTALTNVMLNCNALVCVPSTLVRLTKLKKLSLANNAIQCLPLVLVDAWAASLPEGVVSHAPRLIGLFLQSLLAAGGSGAGAGAGSSAEAASERIELQLPYRGHAGQQCTATVALGQGWRGTVLTLLGSAASTEGSSAQNGSADVATATMAVQGDDAMSEDSPQDGASSPASSSASVQASASSSVGWVAVWPSDLLDLDLRPLVQQQQEGQEQGVGAGAGASMDVDGAVQSQALSATGPSRLSLPACCGQDYEYKAGHYTAAVQASAGAGAGSSSSPASAAMPRFDLSIDINPLLKPACGVWALAGGDMLEHQYQVPLVEVMRKRREAAQEKKH